MGPFVFLDIETTGLDPNRDHIIEIAVVKWADGKIIDRFESLVNPRTPIPQNVTLLTGINDEMVAAAPTFAEIKDKIVAFAGDFPVVGHNITFDTSFLKSHHFALTNPEIDTLHLARILHRKESSYALEVLMKKYNLPLRNSHRAMADVETTIDFFEFLHKKIGEIPEKISTEIQEILKKTDWAGKEFFTLSKDIKEAPTSITERIKKEKKQISSIGKFWNEKVTENFLNGTKIILQSGEKIPFENLKKQPLVVAFSTTQKREEVALEAQKAGLIVSVLKEPQFYLSPRILSEKLHSDSFKIDEAQFIIRMLLWNRETVTGDSEEITLQREDYGFFETFADLEGNDIFFKKAQSDAFKSDIILIHQFGLARGLLPQEKVKNRALIITEAAHLEDCFSNALRKRFTLARIRPFFGDKAIMVFGLLGIFYDRFSGRGTAGFDENVMINDEARKSPTWTQFCDAVTNLPDCSQKEDFKKALLPQNNRVQWVNSYANEISYSSAPIYLGEYFNGAIAGFSKVLIQSEAIRCGDSFNFFRELFELDSSWEEVIGEPSARNLSIEIPEKLPAPFSENYFKICEKLLLELIEAKKGRCMFLLSSKKVVEITYKMLLPKTPPDVKLLAVGNSGGMGKSLALFSESPANSVILVTNQILPHLQEIESEIETIVFQKIPFDPPSDPVLKARSQQFDDPFNEYTVPRASIKFREFLNELGRGDKPKTCFILDSRIKEKDYGNLFL